MEFTFDTVVGNPPYVKFQDRTSESKGGFSKELDNC